MIVVSGLNILKFCEHVHTFSGHVLRIVNFDISEHLLKTARVLYMFDHASSPLEHVLVMNVFRSLEIFSTIEKFLNAFWIWNILTYFE